MRLIKLQMVLKAMEMLIASREKMKRGASSERCELPVLRGQCRSGGSKGNRHRIER